MDKYDRNFKLLIEKRDGQTLTITRPFTVEFEIHRNSLQSSNVAQIRIYNLHQDTRNQIRHNQFDMGTVKRIEFSAGYGDNLGLAFKGTITQAFSTREGNNIITEIVCLDGGFAYVNSASSQAFPSGTTEQSIIVALAKDLKDVKIGAIGSFPNQISRGNAHSGPTGQLLSQISGNGFFIDSGKAHCLNDDECIAGDILLVNAKTGLLGTPTQEQVYLTFDMLFEPALRVGQLVKLESDSAQLYNGIHKVMAIKHHGVISEAVCGNAISSISLLGGSFTSIPEQS